MKDHGKDRYEELKLLCEGRSIPRMFVDLDSFDENAREIIKRVKDANQKLRPATKSIRVVHLLHRLRDLGGDVIKGWMCFSPSEACFLKDEGLDDFLVAYPATNPIELKNAWELQQRGGKITLMVDSPEHITAIEKHIPQAGADNPVRVCLDVDMSLRLFGGLIHLGVKRSSLRTVDDVKRLLEFIAGHPQVRVTGLMGYEAQVAGLPDSNPFAPLLNWPKKLIRLLSVKHVKKLRKSLLELTKSRNIELEIFNGGGTGSLSFCLDEPWLNEVTAGSGFLQSHLFDYYHNHSGWPALFFALPVTRFPDRGIITCQSGGFVASGEASTDKLPRPWLPNGLNLISAEGVGEVQTPIVNNGNHDFYPGDPVFFRPAKAGEIAERFNEYTLIKAGKIVEEVKTYRGYGKAFY